MDKYRLDIFLVRQHFFPSREKAVDAIKNGQVLLDGKTQTKPSCLVNESNVIRLGEEILPYVSKGGLKLEKAVKKFHLNFEDKTILDVGCSTGGFADCALKHGAKFVCGIDVGSGQLDERLKDNPKLKYIENLNIKDLTAQHINNQTFDFVVADLSFISLSQIFAPIQVALHKQSQLVLLIKPQFELNASSLDKNGIVKNPKHHKIVLEKIVANAQQYRLFLQHIDFAPLMTYKKNIEYISCFSFVPQPTLPDFNNLINSAFKEKQLLK